MRIHEDEDEDPQQLPKILDLEKIAGLDEVGRGALFGPVFAAAIVLDKQSEIELIHAGIQDSKKLTPAKRASLVPNIKALSKNWAIGQASAREIDAIGIRLATEKAMIRAIHRLKPQPEMLLVDGCLPLSIWEGQQKTLIRGEEKSIAIASASVLAKVTRDNLIKRLANQYPQYGLEKHVGYGTALHRKNLISSGPCKLHRRSFLSRII